MKNILFLLTFFASFKIFSQRIYTFKDKNGEEKTIYLIYKEEIKPEYKNLKTIRTKYSDNMELNSFESQMNYLANLCLEKGGNAIWVKWIEEILPNSFVMSAYVYNLSDTKLKINNKNNKHPQTELMIYRPKGYNGLSAELSKLEILINNEPLRLKKGTAFNINIEPNEDIYIEIPKHNIKEKISIIQGEKNYMRFSIHQKSSSTTASFNQIVIPIGNTFPTFQKVNEIQAQIEMEK